MEPTSPGPELIMDFAALVLAPGQSTRLGVTLRQDGVNYRTLPPNPAGWPEGTDITWTSSNTAVASVANDGVVTALSAGRAVIAAAVEGQTVNATLEVRSGPPVAQYQRVSLGSASACALGITGEIACWGSNWYGSLGNGRATPFSGSLAPMPILSGTTFMDVAVGSDHACAISSPRRLLLGE
jgi:hypothetical protein